ncbi:MAG: hypothetical protein K2I08_02180 [Muribaculaceae bacterium]|nr:hypothetical protein [Muribaculaceae bacterium]
MQIAPVMTASYTLLDAVISRIREAASRSGIHHSTVEAETEHCPFSDKSIIPNE